MDENLQKDFGAWLVLMRRSCTRLASTSARTLSDVGLNMPQFNALSIVGERGLVTMSALSRELGVTMGAGTNLMERLVNAEYVERVRDTHDRRIVRVRLTPKGGELVKKCNAGLAQIWTDLLAQIGATKRAEFLATYRDLFDLLERTRVAKAPRPVSRREPQPVAAVAG